MRDQFLVRAALNDSAVIEYEDLIGLTPQVPDVSDDVEYTFYGLGCLALNYDLP